MNLGIDSRTFVFSIMVGEYLTDERVPLVTLHQLPGGRFREDSALVSKAWKHLIIGLILE